MKPVLKKEDAIHYVDEADIITFIDENSDMEWNNICDFVKDKNITSKDGDKIFWDKQDLTNRPENYNKEVLYWIGGFFEAHPWIEKMMVVFDS